LTEPAVLTEDYQFSTSKVMEVHCNKRTLVPPLPPKFTIQRHPYIPLSNISTFRVHKRRQITWTVSGLMSYLLN